MEKTKLNLPNRLYDMVQANIMFCIRKGRERGGSSRSCLSES